MADFEDEIKTAIQHAGAVLLLDLRSVGRGYATLVAHEPLVTKSVELAHAEATARGVDPESIAITAPQVVEAAQAMGAAGVDAAMVASETKSEAAVKAEADAGTEAKDKAEFEAAEAAEKNKAAADAATAHVTEHEPEAEHPAPVDMSDKP